MFDIQRIPRIMVEFGWLNGLRLMKTWFSRPAAVAPHYGIPVTDVIKMDWVLGYERAKRVYDKLVREQIWNNVPAQKEITKMLARNALLGNGPSPLAFGDLTQRVPLLDPDYINYRAVDGYDLPLSDLTAALGAFVFRVVVAGSVKEAQEDPISGTIISHEVTIEEVGVYVRDSFDFQGDQFLGYWDYYVDDDGDHVTVSPIPWGWGAWWGTPKGNKVTNADFRNWRKKTSKGGDFLVFSDLKRWTLRPPVTFYTSG
jgi:hypothetical protein